MQECVTYKIFTFTITEKQYTNYRPNINIQAALYVWPPPSTNKQK